MDEKNSTQEPEKRSLLKKVLFFFFIIILLFYFYIRFIEPNSIKIYEYAVIDEQLPDSFDGIKIIHFSDVLYGSTINTKNLQQVIKKINDLKPDIVIFTGDLFNSSIKLNDMAIESIKEELKQIQVTLKKYAVIGNSDYTDKETYLEIMNDAGFLVLENTFDLLYYGGNDPLMFVGTSSSLEQEQDINASITSEEETQDYYKIWLNHEPIIMDELANTENKPNLIFSGHTLGGLIKMPFIGYLLKQNGISTYTDSYYAYDNMKMYISKGLGTYKYNVRFKNMPSINLYRFYKN